MAETPAINFRIEEEYRDLLRARAKALGVTQSAYARMLLRQALDSPAIEAATAEVWYEVQPLIHVIVGRTIKEAGKELPLIVDDVLARQRAKRQA